MKQDKVTINHGKIVNIYTVYEISNNYPVTSYSTMESCLFGALSLTKNMLISLGTNILDIELDFIDMEVFHLLVLD